MIIFYFIQINIALIKNSLDVLYQITFKKFKKWLSF